MSARHPRLRHALLRTATAVAALAVATTGLVSPAAATGSTATAMTVYPARATRTPGQGVNVTWTLTSNGHRLAGKTVTIYRRPTNSTTWTKVVTKTLNSYGTASAYAVVRGSTWFVARFSGDATYKPVSKLSTVTVTTSLGQRAVTEASRHKGAPYQYGAVGPDRFDCSGFTRYVWSRLGKSLPHNSGQQYGAVRHVAKSSAQVGDLIFIYSSSGIYHVGIYAGGGYFWHSPHTGDVVKKAPIYTSSYYVGRVA
jgi:cell wall-associated NlpC family hydrolase